MERLTLDDMTREELIELIKRLQRRAIGDITQDDLRLVRVQLMRREADAMLSEANERLLKARTCSPGWWAAQAKFGRVMKLRRRAGRLSHGLDLSDG